MNFSTRKTISRCGQSVRFYPKCASFLHFFFIRRSTMATDLILFCRKTTREKSVLFVFNANLFIIDSWKGARTYTKKKKKNRIRKKNKHFSRRASPKFIAKSIKSLTTRQSPEIAKYHSHSIVDAVDANGYKC